MTLPEPARRGPSKRWLPVIVVAAALLVVGIAAQGAGVSWREAELPDAPGEQESMPLEFESPMEELPTGEPRDTVEDGFTLPPWVSWLVLGLLIGVPACFVLLFLVRRLVDWLMFAPRVSGVAEPETLHLHRDFAIVEDAVTAALAEMDLGADPRSAIIACWVHFEQAAGAVGIERESSDTPADLVRRLLERHQLDGEALRRLSESYLRARYSPREVDESDRDQARDALLALRSQLGVREGR
ncbi:DUF4129 domain-containing protein [Glycomyces paridis]|uniref:DUF4129 domain-containing protein n=1 Tax=Glycomyces paridis TaxID=2126555 RepID=A0A4S8PQY5_9ACTN|nr:DUF4129 domain-containing protein [Glycomyces paridis]THV32042.1 DUF4129 domain-containing protein [Glycomyces paridis]